MTSFPGESVEYRQARNQLLQEEIELRRMTEAVAAARRALPSGGVVPDDYLFEGAGPDGFSLPVRLSQLFEEGKDTLFTYNMMFPALRTRTSPARRARSSWTPSTGWSSTPASGSMW
jgi:predicted dithiol-disulfide oxidoreductase (DUF899 family)